MGPQYTPKTLRFRSGESDVSIPTPTPTISIVVPSLNQGLFLERALRSVLDQNYPRMELIVVDGASTDGSTDVIERYASRISWWCSERDAGQGNAINKGFRHATGDLMAWLNADDQLIPGALRKVARYLTSDADADAIYGHRILIDEQDREIGRWVLPPHSDQVLTWMDFVPQETLFWRRRLWEKAGAELDESFQFAMDWDLLVRFRGVGACFRRIPHFLGLFRIHPTQKTSSQMADVGIGEMQKLRTRILGYPPSRFRVAQGAAGYLMKGRVVELLWRAGIVRYD